VPDHALILGVMFRRFGFEKFNALLAQRKRDFYALFTESQLLWRRKEVADNFYVAKWLICVFDFRAHKLPCLSANNRRCAQRKVIEGMPVD